LDTEKLNRWLTLGANLGVLVGIVFLSVEIRQNTNAVAAQAILSLNEFGNETSRSVSLDEDFAKLVTTGHQDPESLTELEEERYVIYVQHLLNVSEAAWTFRQRGLISDEEFQGWQKSTCSWLAQSGVDKLWKSGRLHFIDEFRSSAETWCY